MSERERISWVNLLINLVIGGWYFSRILALPADADLWGPRTAAFAVGLIVTAIVVAIVCEILLRIIQRTTGGGADAAGHDERDALINLKAMRNAHGMLGAAVVVVLVQIALIEWLQRYRGWRGDPQTVLELLATGPLQSMHVAQLLLLALMLTTVTLNASRIYFYRRGY
jgi:hypothetical protein